jgi:hypothetical protein
LSQSRQIKRISLKQDFELLFRVSLRHP